MNLKQLVGVVSSAVVLFAVGAAAQCPNLVGTWSGNFNTICSADEGLSTDLITVLVIQQEGCVFKGVAIDPSPSTNGFTGAIQIFSGLPTNVVLTLDNGVGLGKLTGAADRIRNLVVQSPDRSNPCTSQGKLEKTGPLP